MAKSGNTGTISFGTSAFTASFTTIGEYSPEIGNLDDTHLASTGFKTCLPDDLIEPGEIALECFFDPTKALPTIGVAETVTITYPKSVVGATAATLAGTAYIRKGGTAELKNGQLMSQKLTLKWNGKTGPTFTAQTGSSGSSA